MGQVVKLRAIVDLEDSSFQSASRRTDEGLKNIERQAGRTGDAVRKLGSDMGRAVDRMETAGGELATHVTAPLALLGAGSIKASLDLNSLRRSLDSVTGGGAETERQLRRLEQVAKGPGLGFEEAVRGSINLRSAGLSAELAERALKGVGNAISNAGGGRDEFKAVITDLTQIQSTGKVSADEIKEIAAYLPKVRGMMKDAFSTSDTEALAKAGLTSEEFISGLVAELEKVPKAQDSAKESFETLEVSGKKALATIGDEVAKVADQWAKRLIPLLDQTSEKFPKLPKPVKEGAVYGGVAAATIPLALAGVGIVKRTASAAIEGGKGVLDLVRSGAKFLRPGAAPEVAKTAEEVSRNAYGYSAKELALLSGNAGTKAATETAAVVTTAATAAASKAMTNRFGYTARDLAISRGQWWINPDLKNQVVNRYGVPETARNAYGYSSKELALLSGEKAVVTQTAERGLLASLKSVLTREGLQTLGKQVLTREGALAAGSTALRGVSGFLGNLKEVGSDADRRRLLENSVGRIFGQEQLNRWIGKPRAMEPQASARGEVGPPRSLMAAQSAPTPVGGKPDFKSRLQAVQDAKTAEELQKATDAEYGARLQQAQAKLAGGAAETKAQRELDATLPLLVAQERALGERAKALEPKIKEDAAARADYWNLQRDQARLAEQAENLKAAALDEAKEAAKKAQEKAKEGVEFARQLQTTQFQIARQQAQSLLAAVPEGKEAQAELKAMTPVLQARIRQLETEGRALLPTVNSSQESAKRYYELASEYWSLQTEGQRLNQAATKEQAEGVKRAAEASKRASEARWSTELKAAEVRAGEADEGFEARGRANELIRVLDAKQESLLAQLRSGKLGAEEYEKTRGELWELEGQVQALQRAAAKEETDQLKKARDRARQNADERRGVLDAEQKLIETRLKNNPFLNDYQKNEAFRGTLVNRFRELMRPVQGESRKESLERETEATDTYGQILRSLGVGPGRITRRGLQGMRELDRIARESQANPYRAQLPMDEARGLARQQQAGRPLVFQAVVDPSSATPQRLWAEFQRWYAASVGELTMDGS